MQRKHLTFISEAIQVSKGKWNTNIIPKFYISHCRRNNFCKYSTATLSLRTFKLQISETFELTSNIIVKCSFINCTSVTPYFSHILYFVTQNLSTNVNLCCLSVFVCRYLFVCSYMSEPNFIFLT